MIREDLREIMRYVRWWVRFRAFLLGFVLIKWGLKNKDLDREVGRLIRYQDVVGSIEGFVPPSGMVEEPRA